MRRSALLVALAIVMTSCTGSTQTAPSPGSSSPAATEPVTTRSPDNRPPPETDATNPSPVTTAPGERVPGQRLWALTPGNDLEADRINLVFAPWGWDRHDDFLRFVGGALSWDGTAYLYDDAGELTMDVDDAFGAALGLFAIEPWRSHRDLFNMWVTDVEPDTPGGVAQHR